MTVSWIWWRGTGAAGRDRATHLAHVVYRGTTGQAGKSLTGVPVAFGDYNVDGVGDVIVGADEAGSQYRGMVFLFRGPLAAGMRHVELDADRSVTGNALEEIGTGLAVEGDVNGDGGRDLLIFGCCADHSGQNNTGVLVGVFAEPELSSRSTNTADFVIYGDAANDRWGAASMIGDVNGDGVDDFAVGNASFNVGQGRVNVVFGGAIIPTGTAASASDLVIDGPLGTSAFGASVVGR